MAAFLEKLFKSRKSGSPSRAPASTPTPAPADTSARDERREHQQQQLNASPSQTALAELAMDGVTAEIRLAAAGRLTDPEQLQQVQKHAKGRDKGVYQATRQALQVLRQAEEAEAERRARIDALIAQAEDQARSEDTNLYQARLDALQTRWQDVAPNASADQAQRFLAAVHQCRQRSQALADADAEARRHADQQQQRRETLELLATTLDDLKRSGDALPSVSALDGLQRTQENRWLEATRDTDVARQEQKAYETHMQALRHVIAAVRRLGQFTPVMRELLAEADLEAPSEAHQAAARDQLAELDWPAELPQPELLSDLRQLARVRTVSAPKTTGADPAEQQEALEQLLPLMAALEAALEAKQFRESRQLLKAAQGQFKRLDTRHARPHQARMQLLAGQFRELSDWQGFATQPKQIALCEQMEYLADQPMEPEAKAERIKELQAEWRTLGGSSDRTLWTRFKAASDKAFEPCKAYFDAKSDLKQANLQTRQAICDQLARFIEGADWSQMDWKVAERIHQTARQEWKEAWPVEFRDNRAIQKRFDDLLRQIEAPLDKERERNEALKQAIVERAQALIDHTPLQEAMNEAKALQTEWKAVGITRHREDRKLWQAFRKACDQIFDRRNAERQARQDASAEADNGARALLAELDANPPEQAGTEAIEQALSACQKQPSGALSAAVRDALQNRRQQLQAALSSARQAQRVDGWLALLAQHRAGTLDTGALPANWTTATADTDASDPRELIIRAEILAGVESPEADSHRRMEIQVQRLNDGLTGVDRPADPLDELESVLARWLQQPADAAEGSLGQRLVNALSTLAR